MAHGWNHQEPMVVAKESRVFTALFGNWGQIPQDQRSKTEQRILSVPGTEFRHTKILGFWVLRVQFRVPGFGWGITTASYGIFASRESALKKAESTLIDLGALTPEPWFSDPRDPDHAPLGKAPGALRYEGEIYPNTTYTPVINGIDLLGPGSGGHRG